MYKPFGFTIGVGSGCMKLFSNVSNLTSAIKTGNNQDIAFHVIQTAVTVASLTCTLIAHPVGMIISSVNDIAIDTFHLIRFIQAGDYQNAAEKGFSILSNTIYLSVMLVGGPELSIASVALQILQGIYQSRAEIIKGNYLEALGHITMVGIKSHQMTGQIQTLQSKWRFEALIKELSEKQKVEEVKPKPTKKMLACVQKKETTARAREQKKSHLILMALPKSPNHQEIAEIIVKYGNNPKGIPAIHYAILEKDFRAVDLLLECGASPSTTDHLGLNCLYYSILSGELSFVEKFIKLGLNPNRKIQQDGLFPHYYGDVIFEDDFTFLSLAISRHQNQIAKYLISYGVDVGGNYNHPVIQACKFGNYEILEVLISKGIGNFNPNHYGQTLQNSLFEVIFESYYTENKSPFFDVEMAPLARKNKIKCLDLLQDKQILRLGNYPKDDLIRQISHTFPEALAYLLDRSYLNSNDTSKYSSVLFEVLSNEHFHKEMIDMLIKRDVNIHQLNYDKLNIIGVLSNSFSNSIGKNNFLRRCEQIEFFISKGVNINIKDALGKTALDRAIERNDERWIEFLISKGAIKGSN